MDRGELGQAAGHLDPTVFGLVQDYLQWAEGEAAAGRISAAQFRYHAAHLGHFLAPPGFGQVRARELTVDQLDEFFGRFREQLSPKTQAVPSPTTSTTSAGRSGRSIGGPRGRSRTASRSAWSTPIPWRGTGSRASRGRVRAGKTLITDGSTFGEQVSRVSGEGPGITLNSVTDMDQLGDVLEAAYDHQRASRLGGGASLMNGVEGEQADTQALPESSPVLTRIVDGI